MSHEGIEEIRRAWERKPALRGVYGDYYRRIGEAAVAGRTLEVGGGPGNLKQVLEDVVTTDIEHSPWIDSVADAQQLPFGDACFGNVVMVDVLHHIEQPARFLTEAARVLRVGGRLILLEPAITPVSWFFYRFFHPEAVDLDVDPLGEVSLSSREAFDANSAIPSLLFEKNAAALQLRLPQLRVISQARLSMLAYPLSGGYRSWSLIPGKLVSTVLGLEDRVLPLLGRLCAFRLFVVMERSAPAAAGR